MFFVCISASAASFVRTFSASISNLIFSVSICTFAFAAPLPAYSAQPLEIAEPMLNNECWDLELFAPESVQTQPLMHAVAIIAFQF